MYEFENRRQCLFYFKFLICFCSVIHWSNSRIRTLSILLYYIYRRSRLMHNRKQKRNYFEKLISRCQKSIEFFTFFDLKLIRTRNIVFRFLIWFLHCCLNSYRKTWKIIMIVTFAFSKFELIERLQKSSQNVKLTIVFEFFFSDFFHWFACRVCWNFDDIIIRIFCEFVALQKFFRRKINLLFCFERRFSRERFNRIELL